MNSTPIPQVAPASKPAAKSAPPTPAAPPPSPAPARTPEQDAAAIREFLAPGCLSSILKGHPFSPQGAKVALDQMVEKMAPTDLIDRMLSEQFVLLHFNNVTLQGKLAAQVGGHNVKAFTGAVARLQSECRRMAPAIKQYRAPLTGKSFAVIHQQNVATAGGQQEVSYDRGVTDETKKDCSSHSELNSKVEETLHEQRERIAAGKEPAAGGRRQTELQAEAALV